MHLHLDLVFLPLVLQMRLFQLPGWLLMVQRKGLLVQVGHGEDSISNLNLQRFLDILSLLHLCLMHVVVSPRGDLASLPAATGRLRREGSLCR